MDRPNFVFVMVDTQDTRLVGAYGNKAVGTPCLDALAGEGVTFGRAYTSCPVCTPARAGIFTGLTPHAAGAWTNLYGLYDYVKTMGQRFRDAGYDTAYVGKWHLAGHDYFDTGICPPGWDDEYWYDGRRYLEELGDDGRRLWRTGLNSLADLRKHAITVGFTWAHRCGDRAERFLARKRDRPFLLVVSYDEPHHPYTCPPEFAEQFIDFRLPVGPSWNEDLSRKPVHLREWASEYEGFPAPGGFARDPLYFGCNSFVDSEIGRVVEAARAGSGNTWLIYTSDHGDMLGAHHIRNKGPAAYDEIARIPLIIRGPGVAAGSRNDSVVSHLDVMPTMLELAGLPVPPALLGRPFADLLRGGHRDLGRSAFIEYHRYEADHDHYGAYQPLRCLVRWPWKLVVNLLDSDELYNLADDPYEMNNLIDSPGHAPDRDRLHDALLDWMDRERDPWRGSWWARRSWRDLKRHDWKGKTRFNPADGYRPDFIDYDTGFPPPARNG